MPVTTAGRKGLWTNIRAALGDDGAKLQQEQDALLRLKEQIEHLASTYPDREWLLDAHLSVMEGIGQLQAMINDAGGYGDATEDEKAMKATLFPEERAFAERARANLNDAVGALTFIRSERAGAARDATETALEEVDTILAQDEDDGEQMSLAAIFTRKDDGRDYQAEIEAARAELEGMWTEAAAMVELVRDQPGSEWGRETALNTLLEISMRLQKLTVAFPVSDFNANPIAEGRELLSEIAGFGEWIEQAYETIESGGAPLLQSRRGAVARKALDTEVLGRLDAIASSLSADDLTEAELRAMQAELLGYYTSGSASSAEIEIILDLMLQVERALETASAGDGRTLHARLAVLERAA
jgi:hypothetical protein